MEEDAAIQAPAAESSTRDSSPAAQRLLYLWSLAVASILLLVIAPPVLLVSWLARHKEWVYPWASWGGRQWLRLSGVKVRVIGRENLDPRQTYVFISNHRSYLDTATIFCYIGRRIGLIAKKELLKVPILGYGMGYVNVIAIDRSDNKRAVETIQIATERMRSGISFAVFAEGTRAPVGKLLPFKKGAFYMAIQVGVPVVPVAIRNTDMLMGKGTGKARPGTIEMVILEPISTAGLNPDENDVARLIEQVHDKVARALSESH